MHDADDEDVVGLGEINDPIALMEEFSDILPSFGFWHVAPDAGEVVELLDRENEALDEPLSIER